MEALSRRTFLAAGAAILARPIASPACILTAEQEEGPYYVNAAQIRRDLTEGHEGIPLKLRIALVDAKSCLPLENAALDVWHCDALGVYSGFTSMNPDGPGPGGRGDGRRGPGDPPPDFAAGFRLDPDMPPPPFDGRSGPGGRRGPGGPGGRGRQIDATRFLRGVQLTGKDGIAEFDTLYPGWYVGRTIHIHLKVHTDGHVSHTGQLFFSEDITNDIAKLPPYAARANVRRTLQSEDGIFTSQKGKASMLNLERLVARSNAGGFSGVITLAVDPDATPAPVGMGGPGGGRGRRGF